MSDFHNGSIKGCKDLAATPYVNPFVHKLELENPIDIIKTYILTVILLPFRVICICVFLIIAWLLTCVGLYGLSPEDLKTKPISGWRRQIKNIAALSMRALFVAGSFNFIKYKGTQASPKEAPILCIAPHSSYVDAIVVVVMGPPSIVAKAETSKLPFFGMTMSISVKSKITKRLKRIVSTLGIWTYLAGGVAIVVKGRQVSREDAPILVVAPHSSFLDSCIIYVTNLSSVIARKESMDNYAGKLINFSQPIYVLREDPNSRQNTIKEIVERANAKEDWPQVVIFPEGTCTNRSALITFKPGAFYPGVPVQPVLLRYPNKLDTFTWTWDGPGALKLLWLTLTQIHSACEIEFLPVYKPTEEEKSNPKLYAKNVRDVMAKALGVPISDFTYDDCIIMSVAKDMQIPHAADIVEIDRLRKLLSTNIEDTAFAEFSGMEELLTLRDFAQKLKTSPDDEITTQLFHVLDEKNSGKISLRNFLLCAMFLLKQDEPVIDFLYFVAKIYNCSKKNINKEDMYNILRHSGRISKDESDSVFCEIASRNVGCVRFDDFIDLAHKRSEYSYLLLSEGKLKKN